MSDGTATDAAFGPQQSVGSAPQMSPEAIARMAVVKKLQLALNARGFGPITVSGHLDDPTLDALRRAGIDGGTREAPAFDRLEQAAVRLSAPAIGPNAVFAPEVPLWKRPNFWLGAVAVAAIVGYVAYRSGAVQLSGAKVDEEEDEPELDEPKPRKKRREKCSTDFPDFDNAEPVKE